MTSHPTKSHGDTAAVEEGRRSEQHGLLPLDLELRHRRTLRSQSSKSLVPHPHGSATIMLALRSSPGHSTATAGVRGWPQKAPDL